jgi:hypothetical protein
MKKGMTVIPAMLQQTGRVAMELLSFHPAVVLHLDIIVLACLGSEWLLWIGEKENQSP